MNETESGPPAWASLSDERVLDLDVRDDLRAGREPFGRIMAAKQALPHGHVLRLRATLEPVPLYRVLGREGFAHWAERLADDDWLVWFRRDGAPDGLPAADDVAAADVEDDGMVVLDVRGLEPPEPMVRTLAALERLPEGATLVQLNVRVPQFLLPRLDELGYEHEVREQNDELVRLFIRRGRSPAAATDTARPQPGARSDEETEMSETVREPMQLDVRVIPPREKHPTIFRTFDGLEAGESFVLVNDHDPFPLRYQFDAERAGAFGWEYLEQGPVVWRVEISRL